MRTNQIVTMFKDCLKMKTGYFDSYMQNTLPMVQKEDFVGDFTRASGHELFPKSGKPKFCSVVSSSALVVNAFAPWKRHPELLSLDLDGHTVSGFHKPSFEKKVPNGLKGTPPHLDVWLENPDNIVAIESKFTEFFSRKKGSFSDQYRIYIQENAVEFSNSPWIDFVESEHLISDFHHLDAAQLVKHYFGLKYYIKANATNKTITLLYIYWQPSDLVMQKGLVFIEHAEELARFADHVKADPQVKFRYSNYSSIYDHWVRYSNDKEVRSHLEAFKQRYLFL